MTETNRWLIYAIASGACAALNGVFAKLTTTTLTTSWALAISNLLKIHDAQRWIEIAVRSFFFVLNLTFNGVMWGLFTRALTLATSTIRVSVVNTSANFIVTAVLGAIIFRESLPGLWWLGATFLVTGSVIIGRRDEGKEGKVSKPPEKESGAVQSTQTAFDESNSAMRTEIKQRPLARS